MGYKWQHLLLRACYSLFLIYPPDTLDYLSKCFVSYDKAITAAFVTSHAGAFG